LVKIQSSYSLYLLTQVACELSELHLVAFPRQTMSWIMTSDFWEQISAVSFFCGWLFQGNYFQKIDVWMAFMAKWIIFYHKLLIRNSVHQVFYFNNIADFYYLVQIRKYVERMTDTVNHFGSNKSTIWITRRTVRYTFQIWSTGNFSIICFFHNNLCNNNYWDKKS
jgi:hypothetical protein